MKRFVRWYHGLSITLALLAVVSSAAITFYNKTEPVSAQTTNIRGWAWSGTTGWISLNSANCVDLNDRNNPDPCVPAVNLPQGYGLNLVLDDEDSGEISGYAWSESIGWICFGKDHNGVLCGDPPGSDTTSAITFICTEDDGTTPKPCDKLSWGAGNTAPSATITGWAKAVNMPGDEGWIDLRGNLPENPAWTWAKLFFERGQCSTSGNICTADVQCGGGQTCSPADVGAGLGGYAWHFAGGTATTPPPYGMGFISLSEQSPEVLFPYLSAEGGDVFSRSVRTAFPPPAGKFNASYLVHVRNAGVGDLSTRFRSRCTDPASCRVVNYDLEVPQDPTSDTPYSFRLGRFDFQGLMMRTAGNTTNQYGHEVVRYGELNALPGTLGNPAVESDPLLGKVHVVVPASLTYSINSPIQFKNGEAGESGAGTIIVRGNLQVNENVSYEAASPAARSQLASTVWIVLGDVIVDPDVTDLAGTFIVLGRRGVAVRGVCVGGGAAGKACRDSNQCSGGTCQSVIKVGVCSGGTNPLNTTKQMQACGSDADCGGNGETCISNGLCVNPGALPLACMSGCTGGQQCIPVITSSGNQCVSARSVCVGGTNPGTICTKYTDCTGGGTCSGIGCLSEDSCTIDEVCRPKCQLKDAAGNLQPDCGRFLSGAGSAYSLTLSGSIFARQFKLERTYVDPVDRSPAERFVADGRLQLNPPPGMADFAKGLPTFRRQ